VKLTSREKKSRRGAIVYPLIEPGMDDATGVRSSGEFESREADSEARSRMQ
jgi:hypothetical protein